jgi:multicomponent Na+:H+ antiporter subunit B
MSRPVRCWLALVALAGLGAALVVAVVGLEPFGHYPGPYGDVLARVVPGERHTGQLVAAVTFDYRGFDTLGEELILFTTACGCAALLRLRRHERGEGAGAPARPVPSFAARALGGALVGPVLVVSAYVVIHGHLTPGGGFSGGVIGAGALLLAYAAGQRLRLGRVGSIGLLEATEAVGAGGLVLIALGGLLALGATLKNFGPLGTSGMLVSAGTIPMGNVVVGVEVTGAVALIVAEFLEQALLEERQEAAHSSHSAGPDAPRR